MTKETLINNINTNVTNKILDNSITPALLGGQLVEIVNETYSVQPKEYIAFIEFGENDSLPTVVNVVKNTIGNLIWQTDVNGPSINLVGAFVDAHTRVSTGHHSIVYFMNGDYPNSSLDLIRFNKTGGLPVVRTMIKIQVFD